jgi:hypothetical protein
MTSLSGYTLVRNVVKLNYPLEASILTYYPLCNEVVISYDPTTEDGTEKYIQDLARRYPKIKPIPSPWNMDNHKDGTEITIQSNVALEACTSDWLLYVQADEAIHEGDQEAIRAAIRNPDINGVLFDRRSFMGTLDREIPEYFARNLLRLIRNGDGCVVVDGMTCGFFQGVNPSIHRQSYRMYNYSRMGSREEILLRSRCRDTFHHSTNEAIEENQKLEFKQSVRPFNLVGHPGAIREFYRHLAPTPSARPPSPKPAPLPDHRQASLSSQVTLALLMGPGERENLIPFFWQFRSWPGDIVVLDDMTVDGGASVLAHILTEVLKIPEERFTIIRAPLGGDFGKARNLLQDAARAPWVLMADPDERFDPDLLRNMPMLTRQLERDGKLICGFPRANFLDGVLVNDIPDTQWTEKGLLESLGSADWPPRNGDIQYRLMKKEERWSGRIHEEPVRLSTHKDGVVVLRDFWILHSKTIDKQRKQDTFYKSLGQKRGMPEVRPRLESRMNLRESTLREVVSRLPKGPLVMVETGTLRDPSPEARLNDGWSTVSLAECLAEGGAQGSRLFSIDNSPECIAVSRRIVPDALHPWVTWITDDACKAIRELEVDSIDLLYLDSSDDPRQILSEFEAALPKLRRESVVVVDDTGPYHAGPDGKGTLVLPFARKKGWKIERRDDERCHMSILSREPA